MMRDRTDSFAGASAWRYPLCWRRWPARARRTCPSPQWNAGGLVRTAGAAGAICSSWEQAAVQVAARRWFPMNRSAAGRTAARYRAPLGVRPAMARGQAYGNGPSPAGAQETPLACRSNSVGPSSCSSVRMRVVTLDCIGCGSSAARFLARPNARGSGRKSACSGKS